MSAGTFSGGGEVDKKMMEKVSQVKAKLNALKRTLADSMAETERATSVGFGVAEIGRAFSVAHKAAEQTNRIIKERERIVHTFDIACRALLAENPSIESIDAVYETIKEINGFEINFSVSASLDRREVASAGKELDASLSAKMIEAFWESTLDNHPDCGAYRAMKWKRQEEEAAAARMRREEEKQAQQSARLSAQQSAAQSHEKKMKEIQSLREKMLLEKITAHREECLMKMENEHKESIFLAETLRRESRKKKEAAEQELATLGALAIVKKAAARKQIQETQAALEQAERDISLADEKYTQAKRNFDADMEKFAEDAKLEIAHAVPFPKDPVNAMRVSGDERKAMEESVCKCMEAGRRYTVLDLMALSGALGQKSNQKAMAVLNQMAADGKLIREQQEKTYYYRLPE